MNAPTVHRFTVEATADGYGALEQRGEDLIHTDGTSLDELFVNIQEALDLYYAKAEARPDFQVELIDLQPA